MRPAGPWLFRQGDGHSEPRLAPKDSNLHSRIQSRLKHRGYRSTKLIQLPRGGQVRAGASRLVTPDKPGNTSARLSQALIHAPVLRLCCQRRDRTTQRLWLVPAVIAGVLTSFSVAVVVQQYVSGKQIEAASWLMAAGGLLLVVFSSVQLHREARREENRQAAETRREEARGYDEEDGWQRRVASANRLRLARLGR